MGDNMEYASSPMGGEIVGTCVDMCPEEERIRRVQENDIHKLEMLQEYSENQYYRATMVKKFQKSSADHNIQIAEYLRTPETLLRTIKYIEDILMDKSTDPRFTHGDASSKVVVYLFIWDRYRMIAKDYTLQSSALPVSDIWLECHERMTRWMIYADQFMRSEDTYLLHAQQNGEQMNNLLKTLHGYYFKDVSTNCNILLKKENQCEFIGYFVIFQIGNGGEVTKYLQRLPTEILKSKELTFAIAVWTAIRTDNYAKFFKLLKQGNILQKCVMFRYLGEVRLKAMKKLLRSFYVQAKTAVKIIVPVHHFQELLLFDHEQQMVDFCQHCGIHLKLENDNQLYVSVEGQNIDQLLPRDANGFPVNPKVPKIDRLIEQALSQKKGGGQYSIQEICRGLASQSEGPVTIIPTTSASTTVISSSSQRSATVRINPARNKTPPGIRPVLNLPTNSAKASVPTKSPVKIPSTSIEVPPPKSIPSTTINPPTAPSAAHSWNVSAKPFVPSFQFQQPITQSALATPAAAFEVPKQPSFAQSTFAKPMMMEPTKASDESYAIKMRQPSKEIPSFGPPPATNFGQTTARFDQPPSLMMKTKSRDLQAIEMPPPPSRTTSASQSSIMPMPPSPMVSAKAALPLLSTTSVDDFIQRTNSVDVHAQSQSTSFAIPMDISRASSLRSEKLGDLSKVTTPGPLLTTKSLSTAREPLRRQVSQDSPRLLSLEKHFQQRRKQLRLQQTFNTWQRILQQRQEQIAYFLQKRFFKYWWQIYRRTIQSREQFFSSIQSINMKSHRFEDPQKTSLPGSMSASASSLVVKSSASSTLSVYQPPHRRGGLFSGLSGNSTSPGKRKPLRDYSIISAETVAREIEALSLRGKEGASFLSSSSSSFIFQVSFSDLCGLAFFLQQTKLFNRLNQMLSGLSSHSSDLIEDLSIDQYLVNKPIENTSALPSLTSPVCNDASSFRDGLVYLTNEFFQTQKESTPLSIQWKDLFWPSDISSKILLISPSARKGLFTNHDCPVIAAYRAFFTNSQGFFSNFRKRSSRPSDVATEDDEYYEEEEDNSLIEERIQLLRCYQQSPDHLEQLLDYEDLSKSSVAPFQLLSFEQESYFRLQNHQQLKQYQLMNRHIQMKVEELTFSQIMTSPPDTILTDEIDPHHHRRHLHMIFLSNYYSSRTLLDDQRNGLLQYLTQIDQSSSELPVLKVALIIVYLPSRSITGSQEKEEEEVDLLLEFTCFPSLEDIHQSCQINGIELSSTEKEIITQFFASHSLLSPTTASELKRLIQNTMILLKCSNHFYQKIQERDIGNRPSVAKEESEEPITITAHSTVLVPIIQYQLTSLDQRRLLQRSLRELLSNAFSRVVFPPTSPAVGALSTYSLARSRYLPYFTNSLVERIYFKEFIYYGLFSFFQQHQQQQQRVSSNNSMTLVVQRDTIASMTSIEIYQKIIETMFSQLFAFQEYYYQFIATLRQFKASPPPLSAHHPDNEEGRGGKASYGIMRLFFEQKQKKEESAFSEENSEQSDSSPQSSNKVRANTMKPASTDRLSQWIAVSVPREWSHPSYLEKCEVLVSNLIAPIEEFLSKYHCSFVQQKVTRSDSDPRQTALQSLLASIHTMEDVLSFGQQLDHLTRPQDSSSSDTPRLFYSWKELLYRLMERYHNAEGSIRLRQSSQTLEREVLQLLLPLLAQRYEILYPVMKDYYRSQEEGVEEGYRDFDFLYYQHSLTEILQREETSIDQNNPFLAYSRLSIPPSRLVKKWERRLRKSIVKQEKEEEEEEKRRQQQKPMKRKAVDYEDRGKEYPEMISSQGLVRNPALQTSVNSAAAVYDTPTIGRDWIAPALAVPYSPNYEDSSNLAKKRKKLRHSSPSSGVISNSQQWTPTSPSFSPKRKTPFTPRQTNTTSLSEASTLTLPDLQRQLEEQKKNSKRMLQYLQEQLVSWN